MTFRALTGVVAAAVIAAGAVLPGVARAADWVKDPRNGCATSNPFPNPNESIRWSGGCAGGKLDGQGTLVWFRDGVETERNDGNFREGELDGYAVTRYPDGNVVHGQYRQGQRDGIFMTVRAGGEHIAATYAEGRMTGQKRLSAAEAADWRAKGGAQQIAGAAAPAAAEEPAATGRTAVASPSRVLPPPPKPAAAPGIPIAPARPTAKPGSNFTLGTQVTSAVGSGDSTPPQSITPSAAPPARVAAPPAYAAPMPAPATAALPTLPQFSLGSQVQGAIDQPNTLSASAPALPTLTANIPSAPPPPSYALAPVAQAAPQAALQAAQQPARQQARQQTPPQPVETLGPARGTPTAITPRRPPWMAAGASDPVALGPPLPGNTPPPLPPRPMAAAAVPGYAQAFPAPDDLSPTEASRRYLAARESGAMPQPQMAALPSYRASQPASPYPPQTAAIAASPHPYAAQPAQPPMASLPPVAMPGGGVYAAAGPEALFKQGYQMEMSGRFREAEQAYEQVMVNHSNTQTAMLANERLNGLRRFTRETGVRIAGQPGADRQSAVVAVNEPRILPGHTPQDPAFALPPPLSTGGTGAGVTAGEAGGGMSQNLTSMSVCTQKGLYDKEARWCGIVRADDGKRLAVEVRDVVLPRFGSWSIDASTCTGGTSINWFSKGSMVRVPRACMEIKG